MPVIAGFILWLLLVLLLGWVIVHPEGFQAGARTVVYTTSPLNFYGWPSGTGAETRPLPADVDLLSTAVYPFLQDNGVLPKQLAGAERPGATKLVLLDPLDATRRLARLPLVEGGLKPPEGYFIMVVPPTTGVQPALGGMNPVPMPCNYDWVGKRIGFFDICEYNLLQAYVRGYRVPSSSIYTKQLDLDQAERLRDAMEENRLDLVLMYMVPDSPLHRLVRSQEVAILGWSGIDLGRLYAFYPFLGLKEVSLRDLFMGPEAGNRAIVRKPDEFSTVLTMTMSLRRIPDAYEPATPGGVVTKEGFITRFSWPAEALDPAYKCYGDSGIGQMALCDSAYDVQGLPKRYPTLWDARCFRDTDCPFWDPQRRRGGCQPSGACEMPVGVRRGAYRRYDARGVFAPFCHTDKKAQKDVGYVFPGESLV